MAYLLEVVKSGIAMSHDLSKREGSNIYSPSKVEGILEINTNLLSDIVLKHLKAQNSPIKEIIIKKYNHFPNGNIYGVLKVKANTAEIIVNGKLNECWTRFTICKELMQLYIDNNSSSKNGFKPADIKAQIEDLVAIQSKYINNSHNSTFGAGLDSFSDESSTEFSAITMAIDFIFPYTEKTTTTDLIIGLLDANKVSCFSVAKVHRMPEFVIGAYHKTFHRISVEMLQE